MQHYSLAFINNSCVYAKLSQRFFNRFLRMTSLKALRGRIQHDVDPIFASDHRLQLLLLVLAAALATAISLLLP